MILNSTGLVSRKSSLRKWLKQKCEMVRNRRVMKILKFHRYVSWLQEQVYRKRQIYKSVKPVIKGLKNSFCFNGIWSFSSLKSFLYPNPRHRWGFCKGICPQGWRFWNQFYACGWGYPLIFLIAIFNSSWGKQNLIYSPKKWGSQMYWISLILMTCIWLFYVQNKVL